MPKENVLIVEDDADIREGVRILLESENYNVKEAANGMEGLKLLDEDTDLVILDIMMPGMSGLRTCEEIRKVSNVPVLFLTAKAQESDKLIGLMAGGDDYLPKPFSYAELLGRVKHFCADIMFTEAEMTEYRKVQMNIWKLEIYAFTKSTMKYM